MNIFKAVKLVPAHFLIMNYFLLLLTSHLLYSTALEFGNLIILCFLMKSLVRKSVRLSILFLFEYTDFACTGSVDFLAVEETFISDENFFKALTSNWSGPVFCSLVSGTRMAGPRGNMADVFRGLGQKLTLYLFLAIILASFILRRDDNHSGSVSSSVSQLYLANSVSFDSLRASIHLWTKRSSYKTNSTSCNTQLLHLAKDVLFVNLVLLCGDVLQNPGPATLTCFKCSKTIRKNQGRATCVGCTQPYHLKCLSAEFEYSSKCDVFQQC